MAVANVANSDAHMAIVPTSYTTRDQSSSHTKQMLHLVDRFLSDPRFSSRGLSEFDHDPDSSSTLSVLVEDFQKQFSGTENASDLNKNRYSESTALLSGTSALSTEIAYSQGRVASYPVSQQISSRQESPWHGNSGDFGSLGFNEADFWKDGRLYSQEKATAVLPPHSLGWIDGSTSCVTSSDFTSSTVSTEFERPLVQRSYTIPNTVSTEFERPLVQRSYTIPNCAEASPGEENILKWPPPLQDKHSSHSPQRVETSASDPPLIYHGPARANESDGVLSLSLTCQAGSLERTMFPSLQPSTGRNRSRKSTFHSQTLVKDSVQDAAVAGAVAEDCGGTVDVLTGSDPRQQNFMQQERHLAMSRSPDLHGGRQPGEYGTELNFTSENLNHLKLKQKSPSKLAARKYRRQQIHKGINLEPNEADSVPTWPLDHAQRERQRRNLMNSKLAALGLLLPKSVKRDRVAVVDDTIQLLKKLERDVKDLQQRFHEAKLRRAAHKQSREPKGPSILKSIDYNIEKIGNYASNGIVMKRMGTYMKPIAICTQPTRVTSGRSRPTHLSPETRLLGGSSAVNKETVVVEFHVHLDDTVTVQEKILKCRCRMDYLKTVIGVLDEFQLDLTHCNIMKLSGFFICIMRLRARTGADMMSATQFVFRLQSVIDVDIASKALTASVPGATISEGIQK